jgi:hypothetical protein
VSDESIDKWGVMLTTGKIMYDPILQATIIPWMDQHHTYVGFAYKFEDRKRGDRLIYIVPHEGSMTFRVHKTAVTFDHRFRVPTVKLGTPVDPDHDEIVSGFTVT